MYNYPEVLKCFRSLIGLNTSIDSKVLMITLPWNLLRIFHNIRGQEYLTIMKGLEIQVNEPILERVIGIPIGLPWENKKNKPTLDAKKGFPVAYETMEETKNGVKRDNLLAPWDEVALCLIKYITCEGIYNMVYAYHFRLLYQMRHCPHQEKI
jgi:hypothetical protein